MEPEVLIREGKTGSLSLSGHFVNLPDCKWMGAGSTVGRCKHSYDVTWHAQRENLLKLLKNAIVSLSYLSPEVPNTVPYLHGLILNVARYINTCCVIKRKWSIPCKIILHITEI